jgi:hypothetical protein
MASKNRINMNNAGSNNLKKNYSSWAIFSIVNNAKLNEKPLIGWRIINGKKVTVDIYIRVIRKFRNEIIIRPSRPNGRVVLDKLVAGSEKINLFMPNDHVLCQCVIKRLDPNGDIILTMPDMIAQIDRRKHLRLFREEGVNIAVQFQKDLNGHDGRVQHFAKSCFDISAGGLSFIVSRTESKYFLKHNLIEGIILELDGKKTKINGLVTNMFDIEPDERNGLLYKSKKVCIQFVSPTTNQQKTINDYIFKYIDLREVI